MVDFAQLSDAWHKVEMNSQDTVRWIELNANTCKKVATEASSTKTQLNRIIAKAHLMGKVCQRKTGIGLFGESQVGKSYLVSSLASDPNGKFITYIGDHEYDFISDINPDGAGKEATGLVTRFTYSDDNKCAPSHDFPLELQLLCESDLIKIILNSYNNDFEDAQSTLSDYLGDEIIKQAVSNANNIRSGSHEQLSVDEIFSLEAYISSNFGAMADKLESYKYWDIARAKLPYSSIEEREQFFSILWNGNLNFYWYGTQVS